MKKVRQLYNMFMMASMAHAKWDYETSMNIIKDKKRLKILGLMIMPVVLVSIALAAGEATGELPKLLGGIGLPLQDLQTV